MSDVSKLVGPDNTSYDILSKTTRGIVRATMESTSTSTAFVITAPGINSLYDGATFICKNTKVASATNCTLQVNSLTAKRIWLSQSNSYCTTHWGLNQTYIFVFDNTNDRWELQQGRDTDTGDFKVTQDPATDNNDHHVLLSFHTVDDSTHVDTSKKSTKLYFNPATENLTVTKERIANTVYGVSFGRTTATPVETILKTGVKWVSSTHMPVIHITGYAYGLQSPVEFKIGFYIYNDKIGYCGVTNMGSWAPSVYLFKYTRDSVNYVAVGLAGSCYYLQLQADIQDEMGKFGNIELANSNWSWEFLTTSGTIPTPDSGTTCIAVPYKANILATDKMDKVNPTGSGSFSLNRKASTTVGDNSFAEGNDNTASGEASHAEGYGSIASGNISHAEGRTCTASKLASHAEGYHTTADSLGAHSEGEYTIASSRAQHVSGKYNIEDANGTYAEIIGNGTAENARSNARTLDWDGNEVLYGTTSPTLNFVAKAPDLTKSNNDVSADTHSGTYYQDVNGKAMAKITGVAYTDGRTGLELYAKNWNTSGADQGNNALSLYIDKSGNKTVGVNAPQAWLDALTRTTPSTSPQNVFNLIGRDGVVDHTIRYFLINCSSSLNGFKIVIELPSNNWGKYRFETIGTANRTYFHNEVFVTTNGSNAIDACGYRDLNSTFTTASGCDAISTTYLTWTVDKANRKLTSNMIPKYGMCMVMCHCGTAISSLVKVTTIESN